MLSKVYDPKTVEPKIQKLWERSGFFNPDRLPKRHKKPFTVIMPPPNANGLLHIGHALFVTLEDLMIRFERMRGRKVLWLPGADHAGFETQVVFDKKLEKEGRSRFAIPRDKLWQEMWEFVQQNMKIMVEQLKKLGASCDWSRMTFTLDKHIIKTTQETFVQLYKDGLLYRGERIVNWCVKHQTTLSDLEVKYVERKDPLYYIKYGPLELATVRLETKFGDTAVAVHPKDRRYQKYIGKELEIETVIGPAKIRVIADDAVDMKFGTGVIKVTPAHDPADFEIWQRHKTEIPQPRQVIDRNGKLNEYAGPYQGLAVLEARRKIAEDMAKKGLLDPAKTDHNYRHNVATCYKCGTILEPLIIPQWFVRMTAPSKISHKSKVISQKSLRDMAVDAVKSGKIKFIPKRFEKVFFHWMKNLRDWNISRQIVWGIRIPAWFCKEMQNAKCKMENGIIVSQKQPTRCPYCSSRNIEQDPDVLDTWFSSGQWPYATLKFPGHRDYKTFYPTDVMETGWDILFFWVARMIMLGLYRTGKIPFHTVYLHGLVRDKDRQKMSKSKGNVIDPLGVAGIYGTDAVRMSLIMGTTAGNDPILSEDKIRGYRNFANKLWNIARFILLNAGTTKSKRPVSFTVRDRKQLAHFAQLSSRVTKELEAYRFHHAGELLYHYIWHTFADKIIEEVKPRLKSENKQDREAAIFVLKTILTDSLRLLHPFMPHITEALWQQLQPKVRGQMSNVDLLLIQPWPTTKKLTS